MDENLDLLNKARASFSRLVIEVGIQYLQAFPQTCLDEFLDTFMPPINDIRLILKNEHARLKRKKKVELKLQQKMNQGVGRLLGNGSSCALHESVFSLFFLFRIKLSNKQFQQQYVVVPVT